MENEISIAKKMDALLNLPHTSGLSREDRGCIKIFAEGNDEISEEYASQLAEEYLSEKTKKKIHILHDKFCKNGK